MKTDKLFYRLFLSQPALQIARQSTKRAEQESQRAEREFQRAEQANAELYELKEKMRSLDISIE